MDLSQILGMFGGPQMGATQPQMGQAPQIGASQFFDPMALAQLQADQQKLARNQALANAFMQQGGQFIPNSGKAGIAAGLASLIRGHMLQSGNDEKVTDILRRTFEAQSQAAQAKHQQDLADEQRRLQEDIFKATQIARGEGAAKKEFALPEFKDGGVFDPTNGTYSPSQEWTDQQMNLARQKAALEAANRQGPADPFREIKLALQQGVITPEQATKAMQAKVMGKESDGNPAEWQIVGSNRVNKVTGEIQPMMDAHGKPISEQSGNARQIAGQNQVRTAMLNYASQLTGNSVEELGKMSPDEVEKVITKKGGKLFQGPYLGALGNTIGANASLTPFATSAAAGQALINNPTGQVTEADIRAAQQQMPGPTMPLATQARIIKNALQQASGGTPSTTSSPAGNSMSDEDLLRKYGGL